ncbi:MAG TPA: acyl-CoA dehydrogenase, partial [Acidimicrobiales bacterium]
MAIAISEEHLALEQTARRFVASRCPPAVPRAVLETEAEELPPFWTELAGLGWLGLHLPEAAGGQGYGLAELAVVVEELGRAVAPGPFVPTVLAAAAIAAGGGADDLLARIASGAAVATVALSGSELAGSGDTVSGTVGPLLCGTLADLIVAPARWDGDERWCVVERSGWAATAVPSLDPTRRLSTVAIEGARARVLPALTPGRVDALAAAVFAAECAGGAGWCLDTAAEYAKVRHQFGRPIGQFQAVKHKCSDMLVATEQARSVAWDAAAAVDGAALPSEAELAAFVAGALAPDVFVRVAKDCIQILGGIGFTWEHDAHLYLRRATSVRQLLGNGSSWRRRVAAAALAGARRTLQVELPPEAERFRTEVRAFAESVAGLTREEQRAGIVDAGYFVPHWAPPWGRSAGAVEQLVIDEELARAKLRRPNIAVGAWAAPTIAAHGTVAQQERWVRPTLVGEITWCQLFSEPGAGSDLAALTTTGTRT